MHPDDWPRTGREYDEAIASGAPGYQSDFRMQDTDGVYRWRRNRGRIQRVGGRPVRIVGALLDIDDERRLLEELREGADRMELAEAVAGFGVWQVHLNTNVMSLSAGAALLYGFERLRLQMPRTVLSERIHHDDRHIAIEAMQR